MKYRWTIKDMQTKTDHEIIMGIINERLSDLDAYSPITERLDDISKRLARQQAEHPDNGITTRWHHVHYQCVTCYNVYSTDEQVKRHEKKTHHHVVKLELRKP